MAFDDLKYPQRQRLTYLDLCLTWRGSANRRDLAERFGVSTAQAAKDFREYLARAGKAAPVYDAVRKTYFAAKNHAPLAVSAPHMAGEVLSGSPWDAPADLPLPRQGASPAVTARLYQALRAGGAIYVRYLSLEEDEKPGGKSRNSADETGSEQGSVGLARWLAPVRFVGDGEAPCLRAYCFHRAAYRTFSLARIDPKSAFSRCALSAPLPYDTDWHTRTRLWLRPAQRLNPAQAAAVRLEYGFSGTLLRVETRKALVRHLKRHWRLDEGNALLEVAKTEDQPLAE